MRDVLIEFLKTQLQQQMQLSENLSKFIQGLTGKIPEESINVPTDKPVFSSKMTCVATHGIFKLYVHEGVIPSSQSDSSDANIQKEQLMKYCTKRADGRWQASKTIDGKRVFVYGKTQAEAIEKLRKLTGRKQTVKRDSFHKFALWWAETFKKAESPKKRTRVTSPSSIRILK